MNSIACYDNSGIPLKNLYQWDSNQRILISGIDVVSSIEVHFCHPDSSEALVLTPNVDGVNIVSTIPNILLQQAKPLIVYVFQDSEESGSRTINTLRIPVYPRPKPADYIYTETEVLCYREIDERLRALEAGGVAGGYYIPELTQPDENTLQFIFTASNQNMPVVDPVNVALPGNSSSDSGQNSGFVAQPTAPEDTSVLWVDTSDNDSDSGQNVDLTGYAKETWVQEGFQPKGDYLTEVPEGYAKTEDIPTKPEDIGALPITYTPPNQTAEQVGADPKGTAAAAVSGHNTAADSHGDLRLELKAINDRLTAFFDCDDTTLDELSEIVDSITSNKTLIDSITTSKVSVADIINNLTTNVANKPLSAAQGVALKSLIDAVGNSLSNYQPKGDYALRSELPTVPTKVSQLQNDKGYLTEHQDISGKLDADKLPEAVNAALAQAKDSGEFDGDPGAPGVTPHIGSNGNWYIGSADTGVKAQGKDGTSVTVKSVSESTADGGSNVVTFSDGKTVTIKNGSKGDPYTLTEADKAEIVTMVIESLGGNPVFGYVGENNNIVVSGNLPDGTYSVKYEIEDGSTVNIGDLVLDTNVYYSVTNTLTNCVSSNSDTQAIGGKSYSATISANDGYELSSVMVTMGGTDISSTAVSGGTITIASVTGNIVITAVAEEIKTAEPVTVDIALTDAIRIGSDGGDRDLAGFCATEMIDLRSIPKPCTINLIKAKWCSDGSMTTIRYYVANADGTALANGPTTVGTTDYIDVVANSGSFGDVTVTVTSDAVGYVRFSGNWASKEYSDNTNKFELAGTKATLTYTPRV